MDRTRFALFLASTVAASLHFAAVEPHLDEWVPAAIFMLVCGLAQLAWAVHVAVKGTLVTAGGIANGGVVALWLISRTSGIPAGPMAWQPEAIGLADALATALEILIVLTVVTRASDAYAKLAIVGATFAAFGGDPRQALVTGATFALAAIARSLVAYAPVIQWRSDEAFAAPRRIPIGLRDPAGAHAGARG
jgi:hypothetical protein